MMVRSDRRGMTILFMTIASAMPSTNSTATVTRVMMTVIPTAAHHRLSVKMTT